jgi:AcrR family transcriptional regulator
VTTQKKAKPRARRTPRQSRSIETVKAIFEASARILQRDGVQGLTTGRIAEVSGYGLSTIYDYFPTKEAILVAMARQELDRTFQTLQKAVGSTNDADGEVATRTLIRAMIRGFGGRQRMRGALIETMIARGHSAELAQPVDKIAALLLATDSAVAGRLSPESLYVLTRSIIGAIRAWAMEGGVRVTPQALEFELVELAHAYVARCLARDRSRTSPSRSDAAEIRDEGSTTSSWC